MTLRLNGSSSGYTEIDAPAVAGNNNLKLPGGNGSDGNILGTDGAGNLSWVNGRMVLATSQASTSGTSIDFTGIPSWAKRVTVMFSGVSTSGTSAPQVQLGAGSIQATSYSSYAVNVTGTSGSNLTSTTGMLLGPTTGAAALHNGSMSILSLGSNAWVGSATVVGVDGAGVTSSRVSGGNVTLSGTLDRIRITTVNGTDTFDAGSINILYEG